MTDEGRRAAAEEERDRAREELRAARHLLDSGFARIALTRAYFACFHAIRAALFADGIEPRTHHGAISLFNVHFVKAGRATSSDSRVVMRLQRYREEADYAEGFLIDADGASEEIEAAERFVAGLFP